MDHFWTHENLLRIKLLKLWCLVLKSLLLVWMPWSTTWLEWCWDAWSYVVKSPRNAVHYGCLWCVWLVCPRKARSWLKSIVQTNSAVGLEVVLVCVIVRMSSCNYFFRLHTEIKPYLYSMFFVLITPPPTMNALRIAIHHTIPSISMFAPFLSFVSNG